MNPATAASARACSPGIGVAPARVALLGTGSVGRAVLARLAGWSGTALGGRLSLVHAANSRHATASSFGLPPGGVEQLLSGNGRRSELDAVALALASTRSPEEVQASDRWHGKGLRIVIDATASEAVTDHHAAWLAQGIHVVTACKLGQGTTLARWQAIRTACACGATHYGDSATVGAGLPLIRSIRELRSGGDRIYAVAGVLSGSLAWLFNHYDGLRPFSDFVLQARNAGYTEPDPRDDLSGEDVRRKLLILARAAGVKLDVDDVDVTSLVPSELAARSKDEVDVSLPLLDAPMRERFATAWKQGARLRFIARLERGSDGVFRARVGLESLGADDPLAGGAGTDNRVAIWSDRYSSQPLVIQGPGAGAEVTAAGLLDDVLRIAGHNF